jgi:phosphate:Na+ symporter
MSNRFSAALSGMGVTALVQSSTATSLMTSSFVGQGLITALGPGRDARRRCGHGR